METSAATWTRAGSGTPAEPCAEEYRSFPDVATRNLWQEAVEVKALVRALAVPQGQRVLEVGCGRGVALPVFSDLLRPTRLAGLDIDPMLIGEAAERLRRKHRVAELVTADVRDMPFPGGSFDVVVDFGTCYHVARPEAALREIARVLAPGGLFVHETRASQLLSHPVRARGRSLPWQVVPELLRGRHALLWAARVKALYALATGR